MSFDANNLSWYNIMLDEGSKRTAENNLLNLNNNTLKKQRDFETLNFDELLEDIDYNILYLNLMKLLQFMESKQQELCFPFISKKYEEIFKAIALDVNVLSSQKLDESYKDVCNRIINVFNETKEFFISCTREFREEYNEVLVFKKVYLETSPMKKTFESSSSSLSSSMDSLNTSKFFCPQSTFEESDKYDHHNTLTDHFKKLVFTVLLDFVKNSSKYYLTFRNLTRKQAEYIETAVKFVKNGNKYVRKFGNKPLYTALWEAVKIFRPKYEIATEPLKRILSNFSLLVKKVNNRNDGNNMTKATKENSMEQIIIQPTNTHTVQTKTRKKEVRMSRVIQFIDGLSPKFVIDTFKQVIEFIEDEQRASLILNPMNSAEQRFYRMIFSMTRSYKDLVFANNFKCYVNRIVELLQRYPCRMPKHKSNPVNKRTGFREVAIVKDTLFVNTSFASSAQGRIASKKKFIENMSAPSSPTSDMCIKKAKLSDAENSPASRSTEADDAEIMPPPSPHPNLSKKQRRKLKKEIKMSEKKAAKSAAVMKSGICFKPASEVVAKNTTESVKELTTVLGVKNEWPEALTVPKYKTEVIRKMGAQKGYEMRTWRGNRLEQNAQLMKALSVPVQSDKAIKMMRDMGWRGGALGARGTGITEPIMPILKLMTGAGLGHRSQQKAIAKPSQSRTQTPEPLPQNDEINEETDIIVAKTRELLKNQSFNIDHYVINQINSNKTKSKQTYNMDNVYHDPADFHIDMLTGVLELLSTDSVTKTIRYKDRINKKNRKFLKSAFRALAERNKPSVKLGEQAHSVIRDILHLYNKMPGVIVSAYLPDSITEIVLTKMTSQKDEVKELSKMQKRKQDTDDWIERISKEDIMAFLEGLAPPYHGKKAFKTMKFRVLIIMKILFFVVSDDDVIIFVFNKALPCKQKAFVEVLLNSMNRKVKYGCTQFETALAIEIKKRIGDYILDFKFTDNDRIMTILKNWRKKTSVDVPLPAKSSKFTINLDNFIDPFDIPKSKKAKAKKNASRVTNDSGLNIKIPVKQNIPDIKTSDVSYRELKAIDNVAKDNENDESSDFDDEDEISCGSDNESEITINSENTDTNKTNSYSITSDKNIDVNSSTYNTIICDKDSIKIKDVSLETNDSQPSVEENKGISTIIEKNDSTIESIPENKEVIYVDSPSVSQNIASIEDCVDLVDYKSSEESELVETMESNQIDLTADETDEEINFDTNIDKDFVTDCDKVINVDVSDKNCDKRHNSDVKMVSNESQTGPDIKSSEISNAYIVPVNYPQDNLTENKAKEIQKLISDTILKSKELPLLMCHGVQNGALIYTCHNKKTLLWLQSTMSVDSDLKVLDGKKVTKMALKFHCLFDFDILYLLSMIERYNPGISTVKWVVEKSEFHDNYALFLVQMDENSVNFIHASGLALFAGVDKIEFSLIF